MAKYSSSIHYKITTSLDAAGITKLQAELNKLEHEFTNLNKRDFVTNAQKQEAIQDIQTIQRALTTAFNPKLGMLNMNAMMSELNKSGRSLGQIYNSLGARGSAVFTQLYGQLGKIDTGMKSVSKTTDKLFNTLGNTVRWGVIASGFQQVLNSAHSAVQYMADLDKSLTNIRLVTDESKESMREFAQYANKAAQSLGSTTVAYTDAALIYAQQGYNLNDQKALADYTIMTANATGQETSEVSEQMTSLINGFQLSVNEVGGALDVLAKIANVSAADMEELATATSKVASTANTLGVTQEQLTAQIGTIVSVTREAPENVGNALKTIYARFGDLHLGETLEDGTDLGKVSSTLEKIGVQVLDDTGAMRDMGVIMEDLMAVWDTLNTADKQATAVTLAGKYQYNRLMALMENSDMYEQYYADAQSSGGTLETMQSEYMESLEGKTNALIASLQGALTTLFNQDDFGVIIEGLTDVVNLFTEMTEAIGGGGAALTAFGAIATNVFSNNIGRSISNMIGNRQKSQQTKENIKVAETNAKIGLLSAGVTEADPRMKQFAKDIEGVNRFAGSMNQEQIDRAKQSVEEYTQALIKNQEAQKKHDQTTMGLKASLSALGLSEEMAKQGAVELLQALEADGVGLEGSKEKVYKLASAFTNAQMHLISFGNSLEGVTADGEHDWEQIQASARRLIPEITKIKKELQSMDKENPKIEKLKKLLEALDRTANGNVKDFNQLRNVVKNSDMSIDSLRVAITQLITDGKELNVEVLQRTEAELRETKVAADACSQSMRGFGQSLETQSIASHIANFAGGLMSAVFVLQSASQLMKTWADDEMSFTEKLESSWMNLLMTLTMGAMAYVEMSNAVKLLKEEKAASTIIQAIEVAFNEILVKQNEKLGITTAANTAAETANTAAVEANTAARGGNAAATAADTAETAANTAATAANSAAKGNLLKTIGSVLLNTIKMHPAITAITAAMVVGGIAIKAYTYYTERFNRAIEDAEEDVKRTTESLNQINTKLSEVDSALKTIEDNKNAFEGLEKGTAAWAEQLQKANDAILEIIEKYPELAQFLTTDSDTGALTLDEEGVEQYKDQLYTEKAGATGAKAQAEVQLANAKGEAVAAEFKEPTTASDLSGLSSISQEDLALLTAHSFSDGDDRQTARAKFEELTEMLIGYGLSKDQAEDILNNDELRVSVLDFIDNTKGLGGSLSGLSTAVLATNESFSEFNEVEQKAVSEKLENWLGLSSYRSVDLTDEQNNQLKEWGINNYMSDFQALQEYAKLHKDEGYRYNSAFGQVEKQNEEGEWKTVDIDANEAFNEIIAAQIAQYFGDNPSAFMPTLEEAVLQALTGSNTGEGASEDRKQVAGGLTTALDESEYSEDQKMEILGILDEDATVDEINKGIEAIENGGSVEDVAVAVYGEEGAAELANTNGEKAAEAADIDVEAFKAYRDLLAESNEELADQPKLLNEVALSHKKMQKGLDTMVENWEEWNEAILSGDQAASDVIPDVEKALADLFELSDEELSLLPPDFVQNNWDLIEKVVNNIEGAYEEMAALLAQELVVGLELDPEIEAQVTSELSSLIADANLPDLEIGATLDDSGMTAGLQAMLDSGALTADQMNGILDTIGFTPEITYEQVPVSDFKQSEVGGDYVYQYTDPLTGEVRTAHVSTSDYAAAQDVGYIEIPIINGSKTTYKKPGGSSYSPKLSKGGGGGGGSSYTPKKEKPLEEKPDRYQDVNAHLDRLSNNLDKIADEQDRLAGKDMLDNMQKQVDLIEQQAQWHQKKLDIQREEAAELRNELGQDYGITFNSDGYMTNYQDIHKKLVAEYDALVDQYNATSDEEGQEKIKEKMDAVKEKIDSFNEAWERYDELMNNEIPESINTLEDLEDQIEDLRIEAFNMAVEAADNIKEVKDAWADYMGFMSGLNPDSPFRSLIEDAEKYENSIDLVAAKQQDLEKLMQWLPQYQPGGVITSDNPFGENSAAYYEALQEAYQSYIEAALDAESLYYDQVDDIIDGYDEIVDKIEKRMEDYSHLTEQLDHYASVIETFYGEEDYDNLIALKRANQDVLKASIEQSRISLATLEKEYEKRKAEGADPAILEALKEHVREAQGELNSLVEEAAQNTAEILEMAVDKTVKEWKDKMLGGDSDWAETQWELSKELADQYLDTVEETYEIEKLRSKYNNLANDTMDLNLRKRINEQMEKELKYLQEKDKLSEYDVNYANAKLEILQKQIALEEAQANKNQMKLRRDSQGNYSYVYTANQDDVNQAQSDLMDAEFDAYSMSKENYVTNYDNYISAISSAAERIKEINMNTLLSEEEKAERTKEIYDWLKQYLSGIAEQIGVSQQGMLESVAWLAMDSSEIVGDTFANIAEMMQEDWVGALGNIGVATSENFDHIINNMDEFLDDTKIKWEEFEEHTQEWSDNVQDIADEGTDGFRDIDNIIIDINNDMKTLNDETKDFFSLINDDLGTIDAAVGKLADYEKQILGLKESTSKVRAELEAAKAEIIKKENEIRDLRNELQTERDKGNGSDGNGSDSGSGSADDETKASAVAQEAIEIIKGVHNGTIKNGSGGWRPSAKAAGYSEDAISVALKAFNDSKTGSGYSYYYDEALKLVQGYDTGGYTGAWGKEGRLAMLHQKELVLNASDTTNILAAVSAMREIVAAMKSDSFGSLPGVFGRNSNVATNTGNNIQQNIEIYADFPAAENAAEIKAALEGLAQQAVQYSKRTR